MQSILKKAIKNRQRALSEYDSKRVIAAEIPISKEILATTEDEAVAAAEKLGYPVVLKGCDHNLMHKTETGMVHLNLGNEASVKEAYRKITEVGITMQGVLVQEMVKGNREFVMGLTRDPSFGPCVMFGLGGIFTEAMKDVTFRVAPLTREDAEEMLTELKAAPLLDEFRGSPAVDRNLLIDALVGLSRLAMAHEEIEEIDINPLIINGNRPVAVDALVVLSE